MYHPFQMSRLDLRRLDTVPLARESLELASVLSGRPEMMPKLIVTARYFNGDLIGELELYRIDSVLRVKQMIKERTGLFPHQFRLVWDTTELAWDGFLADYNIPATGAVFTVIVNRRDP